MFRLLFITSFFVCAIEAQVIINEISAIQSDRLLRWDDQEQPYVGSGPAWWSREFDSGTWNEGPMPLGFSLGAISTNLSSQLLNTSPSFFVRKSFQVSPSQASSDQELVLRINFNDGFIAWLNGREIARENMGAPKAHVYHDQLSYRSSQNTTALTDYSIGSASTLLDEGENVLAIQINNSSLSGNMRLDMALIIDGHSSLFEQGTVVSYLAGLSEPTSDLSEPTLPTSGPSDWIELANTEAEAINLGGWSLTDNEDSPRQWIFPAETILEPNGYLVILADGQENQLPNAHFLHANFKLNSNGEFLGLYDSNGILQSQIEPKYPKQKQHHSFARSLSGAFGFSATPTPGRANSANLLDSKVDAPSFDHQGGFYDSSLTLTLSSNTPQATIRYTTDGTHPTLENGITYSTPLTLTTINTRKGHVIRARAFKEGLIASSTKTHTYLIGQDQRVRSNPALVFAGEPERSLYDPFGVLAINGGVYVNNQWQAREAFDYNNSINRGRAYERPIHAEFYFPDGSVGFRSDVGLRIASSSYSRPRMILNQVLSYPWPNNPREKPSFNLYFRDDYGNPSVRLPFNGPDFSVNEYERFRIRAGKNDINNPFVIDELVRRLSRDMGQGASNGVINSLYVNGELKGFYNMVERLREPFFRSLHQSEPGAQWDVLQFEGNDNISEGDKVAWNDMISRLNASTTLENWQRVCEVADVVNMADYYLLNIYCATWDWPHNNWVAAKERSAAGRYRLYVWDAEGAMNNRGDRPVSQEMISTFMATGSGELRDLWRGLTRWSEFQILFADRIHKHMFHGGVLDDRDYENSHLKSRFDELAQEFGALLNLLNNQSMNTSIPSNWARETSGRRRYLLGPSREDFRNHNLWPEISPPMLSQYGGIVPKNYPLIMTSENASIYYTTDGSDPRLPGGSPSPNASIISGQLADEEIVPLGSIWSLSDNAGDLGLEWKDTEFDDSGWVAGPAPLGYGTIRDNVSGETHVIATPANKRNGQPTTYFRHHFAVDDPSSYLDLTLSLRIDGGAIVYLNGVEVHRDSNLPEIVTYSTVPNIDASDGNEGDLDSYPLERSLLQKGQNLLAIEIHNIVSNSDMVLDAQLSGKKTRSDNPPLLLSSPLEINARVLENGSWSALSSAGFSVDSLAAASSNLVISEFLYNPIGASVEEEAAGFTDGDLFEFLRIENTSTQPLDLTGVQLTRGITFDFNDSPIRSLAPGKGILLVANLEAFQFRYGHSYDGIIAGQYLGQLSNEGETIRMIGATGEVIHEFKYETSSPWPDLADLDGHSLVLVDHGAEHSLPTNWQPSDSLGGNPGGVLGYENWLSLYFQPEQLSDPEVTGSDADPDQDGWGNFWEFALGTNPLLRGDFPPPIESAFEMVDGESYLTLSLTQKGELNRVDFSVETSDDLSTWLPGGLRMVPDLSQPDGTRTIRFRHLLPWRGGKQFLRVKASR